MGDAIEFLSDIVDPFGVLHPFGNPLVNALNPDVPNPTQPTRDNSIMVRESDRHRRLIYGREHVGGIWAYMETTGASNDILHLILIISDGPNNSLEGVMFDEDLLNLVVDSTDANGIDRLVPSSGSTYENLAQIKFYEGNETQVGDLDLISESGLWTTDHRLLGISYAYVRLVYDRDVYPNGIPNISFIVEGIKDIKDTRASDVQSYTTNCALALAHYLTSPLKGLAANYDDEIDKTELAAAANVCDENVSLKAGGTEKRYTFNGVINTSMKPSDVIETFTSSMAGYCPWVSGKFAIQAGAYIAPTFAINEDMIIGTVNLKNRIPKRDRFNAVKGTFIDEDNGWRSQNYPEVNNATYEIEDGQRINKEIDFIGVKSSATCQRLAKIYLERNRLNTTLQITCNFRAYRAIASKTVKVNISRFNYNEEVFLVTKSGLSIGTDGMLSVELSLKKTASSVYNWTPASDEKSINIPPPISFAGTKVANIVASPTPGTYLNSTFPITVTLSTATTMSTIRYSFAGIPMSIGQGAEYIAPLIIAQNETVWLKAFRDGFESSNGVGFNYHAKVDPVVPSQVGGAYDSGDYPLNITLSTVTSGATIRWSKSSMPSSSTDGNAYSGNISIDAGDTLYAKAFKSGFEDSEGITETYTST